MAATTLGDLAQAFALRHRNTILREDIIRYNNELTTGMTTDVASHLGGSYARLTEIERGIRLVEGYRISITEAQQYADMVQERLEQIALTSQNFANNLLIADFSSAEATTVALSEAGRSNLAAIVDAMNSQSAGRSLFSGDATDRAGLVDSDAIFTEIRTNVIAAATNASEVETLLQAWFDDPAGFETFAYLGSNDDLASFRMSETASVTVNVKAKDEEIKAILLGTALASVADDATLGLDFEEQGRLLRRAAERLLSAQNDLITVQAGVGLAQERIEEWTVRVSTEKLSLDNAKGALLEIDPYEAATRLEAAQFQLESLYTITTRLSQLSLVNYLR